MENMVKSAIAKLEERGVTIHDIAIIVHEIQGRYQNITVEECKEMVLSIISKREALYTILTGIAIDEAVERELFDSKINKVINDDDGLYGLDEILALSIVNMNGSIALTNFGYLDKVKPGIIGKLDEEGKGSAKCHTFLDDIICAVASSAASRIAHK